MENLIPKKRHEGYTHSFVKMKGAEEIAEISFSLYITECNLEYLEIKKETNRNQKIGSELISWLKQFCIENKIYKILGIARPIQFGILSDEEYDLRKEKLNRFYLKNGFKMTPTGELMRFELIL